MIFLDEEGNTLEKGAIYILTRDVDVADIGQELELVSVTNTSVDFRGSTQCGEESLGVVVIEFKVDSTEDSPEYTIPVCPKKKAREAETAVLAAREAWEAWEAAKEETQEAARAEAAWDKALEAAWNEALERANALAKVSNRRKTKNC